MQFRCHQRAWIVLVLIVSVFTFLLTVYAMGFRLVISQSVPRGLYRAVDVPLQRGTFVAFCLSSVVSTFATARRYVPWGTCPGGTQPVVKPIGAIAGDTIELRSDGIVVNGTPLPNSATLARDAHDRSLPHVPWGSYVVAADEIWLFATHIPESWDSRYFGPIRHTQIIATARPVWTLNE